MFETFIAKIQKILKISSKKFEKISANFIFKFIKLILKF